MSLYGGTWHSSYSNKTPIYIIIHKEIEKFMKKRNNITEIISFQYVKTTKTLILKCKNKSNNLMFIRDIDLSEYNIDDRLE